MHEVNQDGILIVELPVIIEEDPDDIVQVTAEISNEMAKWIRFDEEAGNFILSPTQTTPLGIHKVKVTLDDSKDRSPDYYINFWVLEPEKESQPQEDVKEELV